MGTVSTVNVDKVTRFEVIDHREAGLGRAFVALGVTVELTLQDNGRTLKAFVRDGESDD